MTEPEYAAMRWHERPEHRAAQVRTDAEQAALKARARACATSDGLRRAADRARVEPNTRLTPKLATGGVIR